MLLEEGLVTVSSTIQNPLYFQNQSILKTSQDRDVLIKMILAATIDHERVTVSSMDYSWDFCLKISSDVDVEADACTFE